MKVYNRIFFRLMLFIGLALLFTNILSNLFWLVRSANLTQQQRQQIIRQIEQGQRPTFGPAGGPNRRFIPWLIVPLALGLVGALVFSRRIARPLEDLSAAAARLSQGHLDTRLKTQPSFAEMEIVTHSFNQVAESLERLEQGRKTMIADIAHELRTPITTMRIRLEGLEDGVFPLDQSEVQRLHQQTLLLSRLVEDLRVLSLADAGQLTLYPRKVELHTLLQNSAQTFAPKAKSQNTNLETELEAITIQADPDRITQVVSNLLDNALRHTPQGGAVTLTLSSNQGFAYITIQDTGEGIPQEALPHVFDRFYRADPSRSRQSGGSGIGLAIVKAIAELHGGRVQASNAPEGAAVFPVVLPLENPQI